MTAFKSKYYRTREKFLQTQQTNQQLLLQLESVRRRIRKARQENDCLLDIVSELGLVEDVGDADSDFEMDQSMVSPVSATMRSEMTDLEDSLDLSALKPLIRDKLAKALKSAKSKKRTNNK